MPPAVGILANPDLFSVQFRRSIYVATAGDYIFYLGSDDAGYLWLDASTVDAPAVTTKALINNGGQHGYVVASNSDISNSRPTRHTDSLRRKCER